MREISWRKDLKYRKELLPGVNNSVYTISNNAFWCKKKSHVNCSKRPEVANSEQRLVQNCLCDTTCKYFSHLIVSGLGTCHKKVHYVFSDVCYSLFLDIFPNLLSNRLELHKNLKANSKVALLACYKVLSLISKQDVSTLEAYQDWCTQRKRGLIG